MDKKLLKDPLNRDIVGLLLVSKLPEVEKQLWIEALVDLNEDEKKKLRKNLMEEVKYERKTEERFIDNFIEALGKV